MGRPLKFRLTFKDRIAAGKVLAEMLGGKVRKISEGYNERSDRVVVAIPTGGLLVAYPVAARLSAKLDFLICKRMVLRENTELTLGSVCEENSIYLNQKLIKYLGITEKSIQDQIIEASDGVKEDLRAYRLTFPNYDHLQFNDRIVILVDDGAASGSTLIGAARLIRKMHPQQLIVGVPVVPKDTLGILKNEADLVEFISSPNTISFSAVSHFYQDFKPVSQEQIATILEKNRNNVKSIR